MNDTSIKYVKITENAAAEHFGANVETNNCTTAESAALLVTGILALAHNAGMEPLTLAALVLDGVFNLTGLDHEVYDLTELVNGGAK
jgi:hypothetical protein